MPDGRLTADQERFIEDVRRHLEDDGVSGIDPVVEEVADECGTCGAYVLNHALHKDFHARQKRQFEHLDELARRHVPPPTYGGIR